MTQAATAVTNTVPTVGPAIGVGLTYTMFGPGGFRGRGPRRRWWSPESGTPSPSSACRCWPWPWCCCRAAPAAGGSPWPWPASPPWWPPSWSSRCCCAARSWPAGSGCWPVGRFAATADLRRPPVQGWNWPRSGSAPAPWSCWSTAGADHRRHPGQPAVVVPGAAGSPAGGGVSDAEVSWAQVLLVFAVARLLSIVPVTPGAAGVVEFALIALLAAAGGDREQVTAAVLVPGPDLGAADPGRGRLLPVVAPKPAASPARHPGWCPAGGHPQGCGGGRQRPINPGTR